MFWPWHHLSETLPCDITLLPGTTRMSSDTQQSQGPPLPRLVRGLGETPQPTSSFIWLSLDCSTEPLPIPICIRLIKSRQGELCEWHWSILLLPRETIQVVTHNCGEGRWVQKIKGVDRWLNKEWQKGTGRKWEWGEARKICRVWLVSRAPLPYFLPSCETGSFGVTHPCPPVYCFLSQ